MSTVATERCPICLLEDCDQLHVECSPRAQSEADTDEDLGPREDLRCTDCREYLARPSTDGLCGFCQLGFPL